MTHTSVGTQVEAENGEDDNMSDADMDYDAHPPPKQEEATNNQAPSEAGAIQTQATLPTHTAPAATSSTTPSPFGSPRSEVRTDRDNATLGNGALPPAAQAALKFFF
jgi:hypothetical protein